MFRVVELFKSIQSEGTHSGTPATFIRLFGCNLACKFGEGKACDEHLHEDSSSIQKMALFELVHYCGDIEHVVITGGEPSLHDINDLIVELRKAGHYVQVETNGFNISNIVEANFITYSPKLNWDESAAYLKEGFQELKLLANSTNVPDEAKWQNIKTKYIQPIGNSNSWDLDAVKWCADWVISHPDWKLSLQTHKIYGGQ